MHLLWIFRVHDKKDFMQGKFKVSEVRWNIGKQNEKFM